MTKEDFNTFWDFWIKRYGERLKLIINNDCDQGAREFALDIIEGEYKFIDTDQSNIFIALCVNDLSEVIKRLEDFYVKHNGI